MKSSFIEKLSKSSRSLGIKNPNESLQVVFDSSIWFDRFVEHDLQLTDCPGKEVEPFNAYAGDADQDNVYGHV